MNAANCEFRGNAAIGGAGGAGDSAGDGGEANGGTIYLNGGVLNATNCAFQSNVTQGGVGGVYTSNSAGNGGQVRGGAIHNQNGRVAAADCVFNDNLAQGGDVGSALFKLTARGDSAGGAIFNVGGPVVLINCSLTTNQSICGRGLGAYYPANNSELASGGAIETGGGEVTLLACVIAENRSRSVDLAAARGGAITQTGGLLSVTDSTLRGNRAEGGFGFGPSASRLPGAPAYAGALYLLSGTASFTNSTLASNLAQGGAQPDGNTPGTGLGGAVCNFGGLTVLNCTVAGNTAGAGNNNGTGVQGGAFGGGLYNTGNITLINATLANNAAVPGETNASIPGAIAKGGGIFSTNGTVTLVNTILAYSLSGGNCFGTIVDLGHNLSSDSSCNFSGSGSLNNTEPWLYPLGDFGGPTPTMPLLGGPAIDAGDPSTAPSVDQRGVPRPYGARPDMGAYEWNGTGPAAEPPAILTNPQPATVFVGSSVVLSVGAQGYQPLSYSWRRDGSIIPGANGTSYSFSNAAPSQSGTYTVAVTNVAGAITSAPALVRVKSVQLYHGNDMLTNGSYQFASPPTLTIRSSFTNGSSFYTLDGSPPSFNSTYYSGPFVLSQSATVRAIGYSADFSQSDIADTVYADVLVNHTLTFSTTSGGTVSLNPPGGTYIATNIVTATAQPAAGWYFLYWLGDASGANPSVNVSMERDKAIHAVFGTTLSTTVTGNGSIQVLPPGGVYPLETTLRLTAIPQPGNYFGFWGNAATGNTNPLYFTITTPNQTVSSIFAPLPADQSALTVLINGRGRVNANPRANAYLTNQSVTLTAVPDAGQSFLNWSGDVSGTQNPLLVSMAQSRVITANFSSRPVLRVDRPGVEGLMPGGFRLTVVSDPQTSHEICSSTNLATWVGLGRVTNDFEEVQFTDTNTLSAPAKFYQAAP